MGGDGKSHQVRLGAGVGKTHLVDRRKTIDNQLGEPDLVAVYRAERPAASERGTYGGEDGFRGVAEQAGGVVAEQVKVLVPVDVEEQATLCSFDAEWKRIELEHRPRVAARQNAAGAIGPSSTLGPGRRVCSAGGLNGMIEIHYEIFPDCR